jgi:hypothetical protein
MIVMCDKYNGLRSWLMMILFAQFVFLSHYMSDNPCGILCLWWFLSTLILPKGCPMVMLIQQVQTDDGCLRNPGAFTLRSVWPRAT